MQFNSQTFLIIMLIFHCSNITAPFVIFFYLSFNYSPVFATPPNFIGLRKVQIYLNILFLVFQKFVYSSLSCKKSCETKRTLLSFSFRLATSFFWQWQHILASPSKIDNTTRPNSWWKGYVGKIWIIRDGFWEIQTRKR